MWPNIAFFKIHLKSLDDPFKNALVLDFINEWNEVLERQTGIKNKLSKKEVLKNEYMYGCYDKSSKKLVGASLYTLKSESVHTLCKDGVYTGTYFIVTNKFRKINNGHCYRNIVMYSAVTELLKLNDFKYLFITSKSHKTMNNTVDTFGGEYLTLPYYMGSVCDYVNAVIFKRDILSLKVKEYVEELAA